VEESATNADETSNKNALEDENTDKDAPLLQLEGAQEHEPSLTQVEDRSDNLTVDDSNCDCTLHCMATLLLSCLRTKMTVLPQSVSQVKSKSFIMNKENSNWNQKSFIQSWLMVNSPMVIKNKKLRRAMLALKTRKTRLHVVLLLLASVIGPENTDHKNLFTLQDDGDGGN